MAIDPIRIEGFLCGTQGKHLLLTVEFVGLGQKDVHRQLAMPHPFDQSIIKFKQTATAIYNQHRTHQAGAFSQVATQFFVPHALAGLRQLGKAVAGKIDQAGNWLSLLNDMKKVEKLGAAGHFTGIGQLPLFAQGVNGRGLAGV